MPFSNKMFIFVVLSSGLCAKTIAQSKDSLLLKNGQLLIGELKGIVLGRVSFDPDDIDVLSIKINKIKTISATRHLNKLETIKHQIYYTNLQPSKEGYVQINQEDRSQDISIEEIVYLTPLQGNTGSLWSGNVSAGYSYTRSSDVGRFNTDLTLRYAARKIELVGRGSLITTKTDSTYDFENADANVYGSFLFNALWRGIILFSYQHNLEQGLARRYQAGFAAGRVVFSSTSSQGRIMSGLVLSQEKSTEGFSKPLQVEVPLIFLFDFYHFSKPDITLSMSQSLLTGITEWGRFRQDGQINLSWKIISDFSVNLQLYNHFDNRPPGTDASKLDYGLVFGLGYKFSQ